MVATMLQVQLPTPEASEFDPFSEILGAGETGLCGVWDSGCRLLGS